MPLTLDTWVISDTHFLDETAAETFRRPDNWQEIVINNWRRQVAPDERVVHLGDFAIGSKEQITELVATLPGRMLLVCGNHDKFHPWFYKELGIGTEDREPLLLLGKREGMDPYPRYVLFSHEPDYYIEPGGINLHGHLHNILPPPLQRKPNLIDCSIEAMGYRLWRVNDILSAHGLI